MKKYFGGLDTLRAIAAIVVVLNHIVLISEEQGRPLINTLSNFKFPDAHLAVVLFFVLSGFLITYLLIKEKESNGKISLKKFYLRRILRIWPLYYLIIFASLLFFEEDYSVTTLLLCLGIFPNIAHALEIGWTSSPQIWSIGVEEQFYLFWPLLVILIPSRKIIFYLCLFFVIYTILPHFIRYINGITLESGSLDIFTDRFFYQSKFNSMSLGAIFGAMYAMGDKMLKIFYRKEIAYSAVILTFILWFSGFVMSQFNDVIYSILFAIMILNVATNEKLKLNNDTKIFGFLGRISYGIYMYHWMIILLVLKVLPGDLFGGGILYTVSLFATVLILTILISYISFISFEAFFLRLKARHAGSAMHSGSQV
ncbi:MAG TPA: acyltransferase [Bacteroidia bacterium]|nr:acyltransferase [Bacteroidia bacterium]HNS12225.1 acyltransferase [Bacteroidia bacterium]